MQKNFNFVRLSKPAAAFIACAALLLLLVSAGQAELFPREAPQPVASGTEQTMYKQLEQVSAAKENVSDSLPEMNNPIVENSNISPEQSKGFPVSTLTLLDTATGKTREISLETYTLCALIAEMPQSFEPQALMAQAVACRTFAVRGALTGAKHSEADVCTDYRCCQSFRDAADVDFDISKAREAVKSTEGVIAVYDGEPILAAYHASSAGLTRSSAEVWGGALDYLVPVAAAENKESVAKETFLDEKTVKSALNRHRLDGEFIFSHDSEGLCTGVTSPDGFLSPKELQNALALRSDTFSVHSADGGYAFTCYGYGHGVGMSQYGADALAAAGYNFYEILEYYYTGISFAFAGI